MVEWVSMGESAGRLGGRDVFVDRERHASIELAAERRKGDARGKRTGRRLPDPIVTDLCLVNPEDATRPAPIEELRDIRTVPAAELDVTVSEEGSGEARVRRRGTLAIQTDQDGNESEESAS